MWIKSTQAYLSFSACLGRLGQGRDHSRPAGPSHRPAVTISVFVMITPCVTSQVGYGAQVPSVLQLDLMWGPREHWKVHRPPG